MHEAQNPPVLGFSTPVFNRGLNTTVRRGRKWQPVREARLRLADGSVSRPIMLHTELRIFSTLTAADLRYEHDPACRTVTGLLAVLQHLYPDFRTDEEVTLCHFSFDHD